MILLHQHALYNIHLRGNCAYICLHTLAICQMNTQTIMNYATWQSNQCLVTFCYWPIINSLQSTIIKRSPMSISTYRCKLRGVYAMDVKFQFVTLLLSNFLPFPRLTRFEYLNRY